MYTCVLFTCRVHTLIRGQNKGRVIEALTLKQLHRSYFCQLCLHRSLYPIPILCKHDESPPLPAQTAEQREKRQKLQDKRKALLQARLAKVREKKLKQKPVASEGEGGGKGEGIADIDFGKEQEAAAKGTKIP